MIEIKILSFTLIIRAYKKSMKVIQKNSYQKNYLNNLILYVERKNFKINNIKIL